MINKNEYSDIYNSDHRNFGGLVYVTDFDTYSRKNRFSGGGSDLAGRITSDYSFDKMCRYNAKIRERNILREKSDEEIAVMIVELIGRE